MRRRGLGGAWPRYREPAAVPQRHQGTRVILQLEPFHASANWWCTSSGWPGFTMAMPTATQAEGPGHDTELSWVPIFAPWGAGRETAVHLVPSQCSLAGTPSPLAPCPTAIQSLVAGQAMPYNLKRLRLKVD